MSLETKLKVYRALGPPCLLYPCETWTINTCHAKQLNTFHMRCLRTLLRVTWHDRVPDIKVLEQTKMESTSAILCTFSSSKLAMSTTQTTVASKIFNSMAAIATILWSCFAPRITQWECQRQDIKWRYPYDMAVG